MTEFYSQSPHHSSHFTPNETLRQNMILVYAILPLFFLIKESCAFIIHKNIQQFSFLLKVESHDAFSMQESMEMQQLIISLSMEPSDQSRRDRLASLYDKDFNTMLFDQTLIELGTHIQNLARAQANRQPTSPEGNVTSGDFMSQDKTTVERQLWAMIDMMVQSKVIAKRMQQREDFQ